MAAFVRGGVLGTEKVLYFTDTAPAEQVFGFLRGHGLDPDPYAARGQLVVTTAGQSYLAGGDFDPDRMVATLENETTQALAEGYRGLRATDELGPHAKPRHQREVTIDDWHPDTAQRV